MRPAAPGRAGWLHHDEPARFGRRPGRGGARRLADFLADLPSPSWDAATLCSQWTVRDVVAHVISYDQLSLVGLAHRFIRGCLHLNGINALGVDDLRDRSPRDLVGLLRQHWHPRGLIAGFGGRIALIDGLIHHQDIRRAIGAPRQIPAARLRVALPLPASRLQPEPSGVPADCD